MTTITPETLLAAHEIVCDYTDDGETRSDIPSLTWVLSVVMVGAGVSLSPDQQTQLVHDATRWLRARKL